MSTGILLAVLGAALLHALWNAMIKVGTSKAGAMTVLSLAEIPIGLVVAMSRPAMATAAWPWVLAAGCTHFFYKSFLTYAYDQGDLSRVYPIARGAAPMIVLLAGSVLLADIIAPMEYLGVIVVGLGILLMTRGVFSSGESRKLVPFALGSACATAGYTLIDGIGARVSGDAVAYIGWVFVVDGLLYSTGSLALRGRAVLPVRSRDWALGVVAAAASYVAYAVSVWAMTKAPIALVAALRETSILFAVLIGWLVFHEKMTGEKALSAGLIVTGVLLTRL